MKAIRVDGKEVLHGKHHVDILFEWIEREGLTEDQADEAIEAGRIEFGAVYLDPKSNKLEWSIDKTRTEVYKNTYWVRSCAVKW